MSTNDNELNEDTEILDTEVDDGDGEGEEDNTASENTQYNIISHSADLTVDGLVKRFDRDDIYRPNFQRNFVWTRPQASRLIESILLGLPIPGLFFYTRQDKRHIVIDGLQRLNTLKAFMQNNWPKFDFVDGEIVETKSIFRLSGNGNKFKGATYESLPSEYRRVFDDTVIHVTYITQRSPQDDHSSAFHIFERLNSGGTPLNAQEMRVAIYSGRFQRHLQRWSQETTSWRKIFGNVHKRGTDQELILRFLGLHIDGENYRQPMKTFLNEFMHKYQNAKDETLDEFRSAFVKTIDRIYDALGNEAFRSSQSGNFSAPYFDALMVVVASNESITTEKIKFAHKELQSNNGFFELTRSATTTVATIRGRIELVNEVLSASP